MQTLKYRVISYCRTRHQKLQNVSILMTVTGAQPDFAQDISGLVVARATLRLIELSDPKCLETNVKHNLILKLKTYV